VKFYDNYNVETFMIVEVQTYENSRNNDISMICYVGIMIVYWWLWCWV